MDQRSWNIGRAKAKSVVSTQLIAKPVTAEGLEAVLAAEVTVDGLDEAEEPTVLTLLMELMLPTQIPVLWYRNERL